MISHPPTLRLSAPFSALRHVSNAVFFAVVLSVSGMLAPPAFAEADRSSPNRVIQYRGPMPLLGKESWGREIELKFDLYRSPTGGTPFWTESRRVRVAADGFISVDLGQAEPLPDEAFTTPFRFLSISHDKIEFVPRKHVVSVVYVASSDEAGVSKELYAERTVSAAKAAAAEAPDRENRLDRLVPCGGFAMETHPRAAATWLEAVKTATRLKAQLPTFDQWYGAYDGKEAKELVGLAGHYEWVVPWVYEPSIHSRMQELYRGKPVACYYNELSPMNAYPFRLGLSNPAIE